MKHFTLLTTARILPLKIAPLKSSQRRLISNLKSMSSLRNPGKLQASWRTSSQIFLKTVPQLQAHQFSSSLHLATPTQSRRQPHTSTSTSTSTSSKNNNSITKPVPQKATAMLPNARLLARAFHRIPSTAAPTTTLAARSISSSAPQQAWTGRQPEENATREKDSGNVQHDAVKEGKTDRAEGDGKKSGATSEKDVRNNNQRAKEEHPEAPGPVIGMNDERGSKGH